MNLDHQSTVIMPSGKRLVFSPEIIDRLDGKLVIVRQAGVMIFHPCGTRQWRGNSFYADAFFGVPPQTLRVIDTKGRITNIKVVYTRQEREEFEATIEQDEFIEIW